MPASDDRAGDQHHYHPVIGVVAPVIVIVPVIATMPVIALETGRWIATVSVPVVTNSTGCGVVPEPADELFSDCW